MKTKEFEDFLWKTLTPKDVKGYGSYKSKAEYLIENEKIIKEVLPTYYSILYKNDDKIYKYINTYKFIIENFEYTEISEKFNYYLDNNTELNEHYCLVNYIDKDISLFNTYLNYHENNFNIDMNYSNYFYMEDGIYIFIKFHLDVDVRGYSTRYFLLKYNSDDNITLDFDLLYTIYDDVEEYFDEDHKKIYPVLDNCNYPIYEDKIINLGIKIEDSIIKEQEERRSWVLDKNKKSFLEINGSYYKKKYLTKDILEKLKYLEFLNQPTTLKIPGFYEEI